MGGEIQVLSAIRWPAASVALAGALLGALVACAGAPEESLEVTATAYNSVKGQTQGDPTRAAWGDRLKPGMKAIAVSRDLIPLGLGHRAVVRIDGMPGEYVVLDKLAKRWTHRIDIYMGTDVAAAREWGKRKVTIRWAPDDRLEVAASD